MSISGIPGHKFTPRQYIFFLSFFFSVGNIYILDSLSPYSHISNSKHTWVWKHWDQELKQVYEVVWVFGNLIVVCCIENTKFHTTQLCKEHQSQKSIYFYFYLEACVDGTHMLSWNCWLVFSKQAWCVVILLQHFPIDVSLNPYKTTALGMVKDSMILIKNFMSWELAPLLFGGDAKGFQADSRGWSKLYSPTTLHVMRQQ